MDTDASQADKISTAVRILETKRVVFTAGDVEGLVREMYENQPARKTVQNRLDGLCEAGYLVKETGRGARRYSRYRVNPELD